MILSTAGGLLPGGAWSQGGCLVQGGAWSGGSAPGRVCSGGGSTPGGAWRRPPGMATAAAGTHPTGMHSCFDAVFGKKSMKK